MKKILLLLVLMCAGAPLSAMIRAGVDVGPGPVYYYEDPDYGWYGPGYYYGTYYSDYPTYYSWRRRHYYGGPYYYRGSYHHGDRYYNGRRARR